MFDGGRALTGFGVLWAFAALFHQAAYPARAFGFDALLVTLPAVWLLLRPSSPGRLGALAVLQLVQVARLGIAASSNHWVVVTAVNLAIVIALAYQLGPVRRGARLDATALFQDFAPAGRLALGALYFFAVFHKLNADFLDPAVSCATDQYGQIASLYPALPDGAWVGPAVIYSTLFVEALVPLLLFWPRTRLLGVALGGAFHVVLALNPAHTFYDFTSMLFALYFLFVPADYVGVFRGARAMAAARRGDEGPERLVRLPRSPRLTRVARALLVAMGVALVAAYLARFAPRDPRLVNALQEVVRGAFVVYALALGALFVGTALQTDVTRVPRGLGAVWPRRFAVAVPALLLFLNGLTPYLGLKTEASFAMFSNLTTEGGRWNHLVLPAGVQVAGYQDDLVRILDSSDREFRSVARRGASMPFFELRRRAASRPDARLRYERGGVVYDVGRVGDDAALAPPSRVERMFLRFRAVDPPGTGQRCRH